MPTIAVVERSHQESLNPHLPLALEWVSFRSEPCKQFWSSLLLGKNACHSCSGGRHRLAPSPEPSWPCCFPLHLVFLQPISVISLTVISSQTYLPCYLSIPRIWSLKVLWRPVFYSRPFCQLTFLFNVTAPALPAFVSFRRCYVFSNSRRRIQVCNALPFLLLIGRSSAPRLHSSYSFPVTFTGETIELSDRNGNYLPFFLLKLILGTFQHCFSLQCFLNHA